jgi:microcompartment protein CcmK/EutM
MHLGKRFAAALALALVGGMAKAQSLSVTPGGSLTAGSTADVTYDNPSLAGTTVVVTITGGFPVTSTIELSIALDSAGHGTAKWVVLSWSSATFNAPGAHELTVGISDS